VRYITYTIRSFVSFRNLPSPRNVLGRLAATSVGGMGCNTSGKYFHIGWGRIIPIGGHFGANWLAHV